MKPTLFTLILFVISVNSYSQEFIEVTFDGNFGNISQQQVFIPKKEKKDQLSTQTGTSQIRAEISGNLNKLDALAFPILEEAVKIWRENLYFVHDSANVVIKFDIMDLPPETAYKTKTSYCTHSDGLKYPIIFAEAIFGLKPEKNQETIIYFNSDPERWYFKGDTDSTIQPDQCDFLTAALRALTQTFGFKASTRPKNAGGIHVNTFVSCFDAKIINADNVHFSQLNPHNTQQANDFITGDNVYLENVESSSKLYAPQTFEKGLSLDYFENEGTLMSYNFSPGNRIWEIDNQTIKAMSSIGWPLKDLDINIVEGTKNDGIISMHNSYTFSGSAVTGSISNYYWEYRIKLKNNKNKIIKTATTPTFTISPLSDIEEEDFETDSYGDILGEIYLRGTVNGKIHYNTYNLYIEKEPDEIKYSYKILGIDEWYYKMEVTVKSIGAKEFAISVMDWEEDFTTSQRYIADDYIKFKTATLTYDSQIFFSFDAKNEYGSTNKDVLLPPIKYEPDKDTPSNNRIYNILTPNGDLLKRVDFKEDIYRQKLNKGFYIIHEIDKKSNALLNTSKVFINQ